MNPLLPASLVAQVESVIGLRNLDKPEHEAATTPGQETERVYQAYIVEVLGARSLWRLKPAHAKAIVNRPEGFRRAAINHYIARTVDRVTEAVALKGDWWGR